MLKRNVDPFKGYWGLVGGHVDDDETVIDALKREFLEETHLRVKVGRLIGCRQENLSDRIKVILTFQVTSAKGEIKINEESKEYGWFPVTPGHSVFNYDKYLETAEEYVLKHTQTF